MADDANKDSKKDASDAGKAVGKGAPARGASKLLVLAVVANTMLSGAAVALGVKGNLAAAHASKASDHDADQGGGEAAPSAEGKVEAVKGGAPAAGHGEAPAAPAAPGAPATGPTATVVDGRGPIVRIENVVVHLRNPEVDRFARLTVEYQLAAPADLGRFEAALPNLRDGVITMVADRTFEQLAGAAGINALKRDLIEQAGALGNARVDAVYVTDFVIQ